ncbi:MAG TPA: hypothetical protein VFU15_10220 [Bacteroidia bacterium]|nr:hypothetical protein [Bacteroidia bacterium]
MPLNVEIASHITLWEIARILGYKSLRSVRRWCKTNGVQILTLGGREKFVLLTEFRMKYLGTTITYLRSQYGEKWREALEAHLKDDVVGLMTVLKSSKKHHTSQEAVEKRVQGENEKRFAEKLSQLAAKAS